MNETKNAQYYYDIDSCVNSSCIYLYPNELFSFSFPEGTTLYHQFYLEIYNYTIVDSVIYTNYFDYIEIKLNNGSIVASNKYILNILNVNQRSKIHSLIIK